ncbi:DUF29 family protein [Nostoc sp. WHI]|uniref:DUF29 family protein n=1 Tax=Nostoc sp. WHI TaxID=2650611 RepID=UPI0018C68665|nr:DUF29 family protein [Nostoc sp. WHI]MBG1269701.1 DUF29 domain-containing protein [Nostoc sp. WHI]
MTQELWDLRKSILDGRYDDALVLVDELELMSRKSYIRNIRSFLIRLITHLIKNQVEQRLTNSWVASIKGSILEIQDLNLQDNKTSHYVKQDEWEDLLNAAYDAAIDPASAEIFDGLYTPKRLQTMVDKSLIIFRTKDFLNLTYTNSQKFLPSAIDEMLTNLPGSQEWEEGK